LVQGLAAALAATLQQQHQLPPAPVTCLLLPSLQHPRLPQHLLLQPLLPQHPRQLRLLLLMPKHTRHQHMPATVQQQQTRLHLQLLHLVVLLLVATACRATVVWVTALVLLVQGQVPMHLLHLQPAVTAMHLVQAMARMH
jgi:hypothetical protein